MKLCLTFLALSINLTLMSAQRLMEDTNLCMQILGRVIDAERKDLPTCKVELFEGTVIVDSVFIEDPVKKFTFFLKKNKAYALRISMRGYVPQLISVNTDFPADIVDIVPFQFNTRLVREEKAARLNKDAMDFPIAIVYFDPVSESFVHNESYTSEIKSEIGIADQDNKKGVASKAKRRDQSGSILKSF